MKKHVKFKKKSTIKTCFYARDDVVCGFGQSIFSIRKSHRSFFFYGQKKDSKNYSLNKAGRGKISK